MPNTFYPTNIGWLPSGNAQVSTIFLGGTNTGSYEGIGFGAGGRPNPLQVLQINLISPNGGSPFQKATITMNVDDLMNITGGPSRYDMTLKEITVCDAGVARKAVVLMSQLYV